MNKKNLKHLFLVALLEWPSLSWIIAYTMAAGAFTMAAGIAALLNHSAGGDRWFTVLALCVGALCFTALVSLLVLIIVLVWRTDSRIVLVWRTDSRTDKH
jgi:hypothetical protein